MYRRKFIRRGSTVIIAVGSAGCGDGGADGSDSGGGSTVTEYPSLSIELVEHADGEPTGYGQYESRENTTYEIGETVWFYLEPAGVTVEETQDGQYTFDILMELSVTLPDGTERDIGSNRFSQTVDEPSVVDALFLKPHVSITDPADPGSYIAELRVTDQLSDETVTEQMSFEVVE